MNAAMAPLAPLSETNRTDIEAIDPGTAARARRIYARDYDLLGYG